MIEITGLQKSFGDLQVLENINMTIKDGDIYGLVGKSGAGKSTLLRCINGLESYSKGSLKVNRVEVNSLNKQEMRYFRKNVAMIFQHFPLMSRKTVYENIAFPMRCWKYDKQHINTKVKEFAEIVGITDKLGQKPNTLSGGQKQRVAIARALVMEPKILLSDESTSALDPTTTQSILQLLNEINKKMGITIIVVTHQMAVVRDVCHNVSLLEKGKLVVSGKVEEIFLNQPEKFRRFLGEEDAFFTNKGINLQIMILEDSISRTIFSVMAQELKVDFAVVSGKMEHYRDKHMGSLILNFKEADLPKVCEYLTAKGIIWHPYEALESASDIVEEGVCRVGLFD
ncbi:methionine ABC transporter ATP-binding protein [Dehalobacterium formicoaceticum]|uniref:Methionine ABC transporter ATP-binding protein n=1 Tax=Dehalobacterium formicoaceticum TaxID=51515 RepID=A0ABT1Y4F2_9FIRM|nr:methionine ABC transporter ATP-binding protein [Dehalobacterium formicoaceticum]MCR6545749.1 methionine ABC transporter ATP-binding protein [Dehalobacterium formicoaceticum]